MDTPSRRRFLAAGTAVAGAAALGSTTSAAAATPGVHGSLTDAAAQGSPSAESAAATPLIDGAEVLTLGIADVIAPGPNPEIGLTGGNFFNAGNGVVQFPITLPANSVVLSVHVNGRRGAGETATWTLFDITQDTGAIAVVDSLSIAGEGRYSQPIDLDGPTFAVVAGHSLVLEAGGSTAAAPVTGVIVQYLPRKPGFCALGSPIRIYDSRVGREPAAVTKGTLSGERVLLGADVFGVPAEAQTLLVNLTVTETSTTGFVALFNGDRSWPGNSSINWFGPNQNLANTTTVDLGAAGDFIARAAGSCHLILDVVGYWTISGVNVSTG